MKRRVYAKPTTLRKMQAWLRDNSVPFERFKSDDGRYKHFLVVTAAVATLLVGEFTGCTMTTKAHTQADGLALRR